MPTLLLAGAPREEAITEFTLGNGMRWIVAPVEGQQGQTALLLYVDAGTVDESDGQSGVVQVLAEAWRLDGPILEGAGGKRPQVLANWDRIVFRSTWPSGGEEPWFRHHAALLRPGSVLPGGRFESGRRVALGRRDKMRQGGGGMLDDFVAQAFMVHPYRRPLLGFAGGLERLRETDADRFRERFLTPRNTIAVAAGDVDPARVRKLADQYFAGIAGGEGGRVLPPVEPEQTAERRLVVHGAERPALVMAFHGVAIGDPQAPVHGMLRTLLSRRLKARLAQPPALVDRVDVIPYPAMKHPFLTMVLCFLPVGGAADKLEPVIHRELERLVGEPVGASEWDAAIRGGQEDLSRYAPFELATELADWQAMSGSWRTLFRYQERSREVTPAEVQSLAKQVLAPNRRSVALALSQ